MRKIRNDIDKVTKALIWVVFVETIIFTAGVVALWFVGVVR